MRFKALNHYCPPSSMGTYWSCAFLPLPGSPSFSTETSVEKYLHDCWQVAVEGLSVSHHLFPGKYFLLILVLEAAAGGKVHGRRAS